ncbi:MAG: gephyrin-like molybdotransferase Glp [Gammaproteobacteria bacterium]
MSRPLTPIADALAHLLSKVPPAPVVETVPLAAALGRVLAEPVHASLDVPAYDNSAMDGYALRLRDVPSSGTVLPVSQTIAAGHPGTALAPGTAARIFTGAPIPAGADAVVMQENTEAREGGVTILQLPRAGENIRLRGHDIARGNVVLEAGQRLRAQDLGLLASLGVEGVAVRRVLTAAIVNTGDEVVAPGAELKAGQLYDSNSYTLSGLLQGLGFAVRKLGIVADTPAATEAALQQAARDADFVITTGGVSVGAEDHVRAAVERLGALSLWKLAIKPGKPFAFGEIAGKPFFGLPGNPVAVFVTFVLLVRPYILRMQGAASTQVPAFRVKSGFAVREAGTREEYLRVRVVNEGGGLVAQLYPDQGSSVLTSLSWADGLAILPAGTTLQAGDSIDYLSFTGLL